MCTYLNGRLIAFTGTLPPVVASDHEPVRPMVASGEREPVRFDDSGDNRDSYTGHRKNGKGGWIARNLGRKPEYKDRRMRAAGSGKTRAANATW